MQLSSKLILKYCNKIATKPVYWLHQLWYFTKAYSLGAYCLAIEMYRKTFKKKKRLARHDLPFRMEHVAIITGGSTGIGLEVTKRLLTIGMHVIIGVPLSDEECMNLRNTFESNSFNCKVSVWPLNLASIKSIKKFAQTFDESKKPLNILINNAGVMYVPYKKTVDGFEEHFQVNYLGHCLLTKLLLPKLTKSATTELCSRIVNVASSTHLVGNINFADIQSEKFYSPYHGYLQSKLAIVMYTQSLQRYLNSSSSNVNVNSLHPGVVHTKLYRNVWWAKCVGRYLFQSPKEGAETVVYAAVSPAMEGIGGCYLDECQLSEPSSLSKDANYQRRLWKLTQSLLNSM